MWKIVKAQVFLQSFRFPHYRGSNAKLFQAQSCRQNDQAALLNQLLNSV